MANLMSDVVRAPGLIGLFGLGPEEVAHIEGLEGQMSSLLELPDAAGELLAPLGWPPLEQAPTDAYAAAAGLVRQGREDEAEEVIVEAWNEGDGMRLRQSVQTVQGLYRISDSEYQALGRPEVAHQRATLIKEAWEIHQEGRYSSAISLAFAQNDGIVADFSDQVEFGYSGPDSRLNRIPKGCASVLGAIWPVVPSPVGCRPVGFQRLEGRA